ncbi:hypothetical protein WL21_04845 [Burkholderia ubonensis]|nr:hypothetical protein WJ81_15815 [Burkholderia ubonensis]KVZ57328.1 hypothetical protein WL20_23600 [Burkholderia ubonensis]KVZ73025.1 hypothetical protein WL21_04845 [Burkholderia ubonensis]
MANARRLLDDLREDFAAYRRLAEMLDAQFEAALRIDFEALRAFATAIGSEVERIAARRETRVSQIGAQPGGAVRLAERVFPGPERALQRATLIGRCNEIEMLIGECKARATRNGNLLGSQFEAMQRLVNGERHTYVPA